ncbi:MAG: hypothetical protein IJU98_08955 [Synergistaceae bacterium]|nr:hypothetical protein [Synergistaceae bacterium]
MVEMIKSSFLTDTVTSLRNADVLERMSIADSLIGVIPADITLDDAREERLSRL